MCILNTGRTFYLMSDYIVSVPDSCALVYLPAAKFKIQVIKIG